MIELAAHRRTSSAAPSAYFARWIDHDSWPEWSPDTEWARVVGPIRAGARGTLKPVGGPKTRFTISECVEDRVYTDVTALPGATLTFQHTVEPAESGSLLGVRVWVRGPLAWLWARTTFAGFSTTVPEDLDRLISLVEAS